MRLLTSLLALLAVATARPPPSQDREPSCKSLSLRSPTLEVDNLKYVASYTFSTPAHQIASGYVNFTVHNPMADTSTTCYGSSTWLTHFFYGQVWYTCDDGGKTSWRYNYPTSELELNTTWTCEGGRRGQREFVFNATALQEMPPTCEEYNYQNPNWTMGQIYSTRQLTCTTPLTTIVPEVELVSGGGHHGGH